MMGGLALAAASGVSLEKVALASEWVEDGASKTAFNLSSRGDWEWIVVKMTGKFYCPLAQENYSSAGVSLIFPELSRNLEVTLGQQWNLDYKTISSGFDYHWNPLPELSTGVNWEGNWRNAANGEESKYRFAANSETVRLGYQWECLNYNVKLSRAAKDYPEDDIYTSLKLRIDQGVVWQMSPETRFKLLYREATGDYPNYKEREMNYWKDEWTLQGQFGRVERGRWDWEYGWMNWDKGMFPYRSDQHVKVKFNSKITEASEVRFQAIVADLNYCSELDFYEPGDIIEADENLNSRVEKKLGLEYIYDFSPFSVELGCFGQSLDYDSVKVNDILGTCFYGLLRFKSKQFEISLKAAPNGDLQRSSGYYDLKLEYKP
jgi:hypothetical protein